MGKIPPMGANVAFSLYGQLKSKGGSFRGCDQYSFINSFYTRKGFTAFTTAMQLAGVSGFSSYSSSSFTADCQGGYGIGCDSSGGFATHSYSSSECDPQTVTGTKNQQSNLNKAMQSVQCVKIYDTYRSSSYSSSSNDDSNGGSYDGSPLALLDYSNACFYQNKFSPDGQCPDPYGKISTYQSNFYKDIQKAKSQRPVTVYRQKLEYEETINSGKSKGEIGLLLLAVSFLVLVLDKVVFDVVAPIFSSRRASQRLSNYTDEEDPVETLQSAQSDTDVKSEADTSDDRRYM